MRYLGASRPYSPRLAGRSSTNSFTGALSFARTVWIPSSSPLVSKGLFICQPSSSFATSMAPSGLSIRRFLAWPRSKFRARFSRSWAKPRSTPVRRYSSVIPMRSSEVFLT